MSNTFSPNYLVVSLLKPNIKMSEEMKKKYEFVFYAKNIDYKNMYINDNLYEIDKTTFDELNNKNIFPQPYYDETNQKYLFKIPELSSLGDIYILPINTSLYKTLSNREKTGTLKPNTLKRKRSFGGKNKKKIKKTIKNKIKKK